MGLLIVGGVPYLDMRMASIQESSSGCEKALRTYVLESSFSNAVRERGERGERERGERGERESKRIKREESKRDAGKEREGERGEETDRGRRSKVVCRDEPSQRGISLEQSPPPALHTTAGKVRQLSNNNTIEIVSHLAYYRDWHLSS